MASNERITDWYIIGKNLPNKVLDLLGGFKLSYLCFEGRGTGLNYLFRY